MEPSTTAAVVAPSRGGGDANIRGTLGSFLNGINRTVKAVCGTSCDGPVLSLHYRWTFFFLLFNLLLVWLAWYYGEAITCVSFFNADTQVRLDYLNICLNYPYVEEGGSRRYLLYYRWTFLLLLAVVVVYYIPRKAFKSFYNPGCKKLLRDLEANAHRSDQTEKELVEQAAGYITFNLNTHNGLYWKSLGAVIVSLVIDCLVMKFLDFILHGRFFMYGFESFPFIRDPQNFRDYMSQTFPPFVNCEINSEHKLVARRLERHGCHLTHMELYDRLFLGLWLWLAALILITCCYIVFLLCMLVPFLHGYFLCTAKPAHASDKVRGINQTVAQKCKVGDIYILYRLKGHLSPARFYELLTTLSETSLFKNQVSQRMPGSPKDGAENSSPNNQQDTFQNSVNALQDSSMNVEMMVLEQDPQHSDEKTLLHDKKADILCV